MESGEGRVYKETVYRPKDTKERAVRKRRLILIAIVILLLIFLIALIVGVSVSKSRKVDNKALLQFPNGNGRPVKIVPGDPNSFTPYIDSLETLISGYEMKNQKGSNFIECSNGATPPPNTDSVCWFELATLGPDCSSNKGFGFRDGKPCFILQFKPPKDWQPQLFTNETFPKDLPADMQSTTHVPVHCKPSMDEMKDSLKEIKVSPAAGFPRGFFPYTGQENYLPPLVSVQFMDPSPGSNIMVTCTVLDPLLDEKNNQDFIVDFTFEVQ